VTAKILLRLFVYFGLLLAVFSVIFFLMYTRPKRYVSPFTPADFGLAFETVEIKSFDGLPLSAWLIPHKTSKTAVIALHGYPMDKGNILSMVSFLASDHNILLPDLRAMGASGGRLTSGGALEARDAEAAASWLAGRGMEKIGMFGFSMGGNTALLANHPRIAARVCDSPYYSLRAMLDIIFAGLARCGGRSYGPCPPGTAWLSAPASRPPTRATPPDPAPTRCFSYTARRTGPSRRRIPKS
jgi:pimeloyl-ACP methyl ester carboxylesterase